jgi:hypothetical protein
MSNESFRKGRMERLKEWSWIVNSGVWPKKRKKNARSKEKKKRIRNRSRGRISTFDILIFFNVFITMMVEIKVSLF